MERFVRLLAFSFPVLLLSACGTTPTPTDTGTGTDTADTQDTDTADTGKDTSDTDTDTDTADTGSDTADTADTSDTATDTADTADTGSSDPNDIDNDGDGYSENEGDCDDAKARVSPDAPEHCGDSVDNDCDGNADEDCIIGDTGVAPAEWHLTGSSDGTATWGLGVYDELGSEGWLCEAYAELTSTGSSASPCTDCDWAFDMAVTGGGVEGPACSSLVAQSGRAPDTTFDYTNYADIDVIVNYDGVGFATQYVYHGSYQDYYLDDVGFIHSATGGNWYLVVYNWADYGRYHVTGDSSAFDGRTYARSSSGSNIYYYFPL